jgi:hypothetical protein
LTLTGAIAEVTGTSFVRAMTPWTAVRTSERPDDQQSNMS